MLKTVEAFIDADGAVHLMEPIRLKEPRRAILTILDEPPAVPLSVPEETWAEASNPVFAAIWDNEEDAVYDKFLTL